MHGYGPGVGIATCCKHMLTCSPSNVAARGIRNYITLVLVMSMREQTSMTGISDCLREWKHCTCLMRSAEAWPNGEEEGRCISHAGGGG